MSAIEDILRSGPSERLDGVQASASDVAKSERRLGLTLPPAYREFVELGGTAELRFRNRVLPPEEVESEAKWVLHAGLLPLATDGCGNLYCWKIADLPDSAIFLWEHDTGEVRVACESFVEALRKWRF
jgi:cell wall assembly regulator SMI1